MKTEKIQVVFMVVLNERNTIVSIRWLDKQGVEHQKKLLKIYMRMSDDEITPLMQNMLPSVIAGMKTKLKDISDEQVKCMLADRRIK